MATKRTIKRVSFSDQIRQAIDASDMSRYAICKALGIEQSGMSRFMAGERGLKLETLDRLAELLGLHVTTNRKDR